MPKSKSRISYGDRLLMGSIGNLTGLKRRLPEVVPASVDQAKVREVIAALDVLQGKLKTLLGASSGESPDQIASTIAEQSTSRSAGQSARMARCPGGE